MPSGPWREPHRVELEAHADVSWSTDRAVVALEDDGNSGIIVEQEGTLLGRISGRPDLAAFVGQVRAAGLPATVQACLTNQQVIVYLCDPAAVAISLDKLGFGDLRTMRVRLRPTGRWMCERCHRIWNDARRAPQRWYEVTDEDSGSPHFCPDCGSYAFTHPF